MTNIAGRNDPGTLQEDAVKAGRFGSGGGGGGRGGRGGDGGGGQAVLPFIQSSVSIGGGAPPREFRAASWFNLRDFGPVDVTGATSIVPTFRAAVQAVNAAGGGNIVLPQGILLFDSDPFAGLPFLAPCRFVGAGMQATVLRKGFNGTWFTFGVNFGYFLRWEHVTFDGRHDAGVTGIGFSYTGQAGGAGNDYHSYFRCRFLAIETHFSVGVDAAQELSFLDCEAYPSAAQQGTGEYPFFARTGDDTVATHRRFTHSAFLLGTVDIAGCLDIYMSSMAIKRLHMSPTTAEFYIASSVLGNSDAAHPVKGVGAIVGCRFAGDVVLDVSFSGVFVNFQTAGTFTDNTIGGAAIIFHHPLGAGYHVLGQRHAIRVAASFQQMIFTSACGNMPDADTTLTVGVNFPTPRFNNALAANRTITLSTTGARNGDRWHIVRAAGGAFTMDVGGLKTIPSATPAYVDVEYDGTAWRLTGYGVL